MENQRNIIATYLEMLAREEQRLKEKTTFKRYAEVEALYNEWIEKGYIKERGYTLRGIEDYHLWRGSLTQ